MPKRFLLIAGGYDQGSELVAAKVLPFFNLNTQVDNSGKDSVIQQYMESTVTSDEVYEAL